MKEVKVNDRVQAYKSQCIGSIIDSTTITGKVVTGNKKSIVVEYEHIVVEHGNKVTWDSNIARKEKFTYWKTLSNGNDCYWNSVDGYIEIK